MTEYQLATLAISRTGVEISQAMLWISAVHALISLLVGGVQCLLIWFGLKQMSRASAARDMQHKETMFALDTRHRESMGAQEARHREAMRALETLIERTSK